MDEKKDKKKTLTISTTLTKKIDISSLAKDGKKSFSIEKKNLLDLLKIQINQNQILTHLNEQTQVLKKLLLENLLNSRQQKIL